MADSTPERSISFDQGAPAFRRRASLCNIPQNATKATGHKGHGGTMISNALRGFAAASFLALLPLAAGAQTASPASEGFSAERLKRIDQLIDRMMAAGEITGAVTLVARDGKVVHLQAQGVMDADSKKPMQKDSFFRMASMTKPVAATAMLMLVEEGKIRLNDPVSKYLPSFRNFQVAVSRPAATGTPGAPNYYTVPAEREVTILDLLTHTSGVMSGPNGNAGGQASFRQRHEIGLKWIDNLGTESVLEFQPGTRWAYSAVAGLDISNRIVEVVTGKTYNEFIQERLFRPLGMKETVYWPSAAQRERLVTAYTFANGKLTRNPDPDSMSSPVYFSGGGGLMSTAESYARFAMMLANGGELNRAHPEPRDREADGLADHSRYAARPPARRRLRSRRAAHQRPRGAPHAALRRQLRLERRLRHALLGGSLEETGRHPDGADAEPGSARRGPHRRFRDGGDAGADGVGDAAQPAGGSARSRCTSSTSASAIPVCCATMARMLCCGFFGSRTWCSFSQQRTRTSGEFAEERWSISDCVRRSAASCCARSRRAR
jgi:CubicO group peptidase (beta-lactamase class C family)